MDRYEDIDLELEELVFLYNAAEENNGIYELIWELGYYDLTIQDKYRIAHQILAGLLSKNLVKLEKQKSVNFSGDNIIEVIAISESEEILNSPGSWYQNPEGQVVMITLTEKGQVYMDEQAVKLSDKHKERWKIK